MIYKLKDLGEFKNGANYPKGSYGAGLKIVNVKDLFSSHFVNYSNLDELKEDVLKNPKQYELVHGDILFTRSSLVQSGTGMCAMIEKPEEKVIYCGFIIRFRPDFQIVNPYYLTYMLRSKCYRNMFIQLAAQTTITNINQKTLGEIEVNLPNLKEQDKIANVLHLMDKKISNNNAINRNLLEQALAIYHKMFIETDNDERRTCRTDEIFDITIGRTPPRKEKEWFSENPEDCIWISISDMGSCGTFITDSSEYLTQAAVDKHNIRVVPDNTVILSFKLTVGRIAITVGKTTTNEAIAHFNTNKDNIVEYLYCYLKSFDFASLGSTSSIGTAVNSKTIKAMDFVVPREDELQEFCDIVRPMFEQIKNNQFVNQNLVTMRDCLLPKLMLGELDVSNLDI